MKRLVLLLLLPLSLLADSVTYTLTGNGSITFQVVTENFIPSLPQYVTNPVSGVGAITFHPGDWGYCRPNNSAYACSYISFSSVGDLSAIVARADNLTDPNGSSLVIEPLFQTDFAHTGNYVSLD